MDFVVSIDTEADNQWQHGIPLACHNVDYWHAFQALCEVHDVRPTYLITSEIAEDKQAAAQLSAWTEDGKAEVGAHLHPWTTPPFHNEPGLRCNDEAHLFPSALDEDLLRAKLETLTRQIEQNIGRRPRAYRAGRFGMNQATARILVELGYTVDSSVTPTVSWSDSSLGDSTAGPAFRKHSAKPSLIEGTGDPGLIEIPVTVLYSNAWVRGHPQFAGWYASKPARAIERLLNGGRSRPEPIWLRPFPHQSSDDLRRAWRAACDEDVPTAVMMFHSSELMPGGSPFRPSRRSIAGLLATLDEFFRFARAAGGKPVTLTEAAHNASHYAKLPRRML